MGARNRGRARADMPVPEAPALQAKIDFQIRIVPADGTRAAKWSKRRLRYVAVFGQLSDKPLLVTVCVCGVPEPKHNGVARNNQRWRWDLPGVKYPLHGTRLCRHQLNFAHVTVVHARHLAIAPGDRDRIPTRFGDNAAISGIASPINPGAFREALRFVDCHCCATARSITGPQYQCQIARRMCFIAALSKSDFDEPADGPSFRAELAFFCDPFVELA